MAKSPEGVYDGAAVRVVARVTRGHVTDLAYYLFCHASTFIFVALG